MATAAIWKKIMTGASRNANMRVRKSIEAGIREGI